MNESSNSKYLKLINQPFILFILFLSALTYSFTRIPELKILVSMSDLVDQNMPSARDFQELKDDFHLLPGLMVIAEPTENTKNWDEFHAWINQEKRERENGINSWLIPWNVLKSQFSPGHLLYKKIVKDENSIEAISKLKESPWERILTSDKGNDAAVVVDFVEPDPPQKFGSFNLKKVKAFIDSIQHFNFHDLKVRIVGSAAFTYYAVTGVNFNMRLNIFFLFALILICRYLFGTFKSGILLVLTFLWSGIIVYGAMAATGFAIEILSSGLFTMLIVACMEDYLYICHEMNKGLTLDETLSHLFYPSMLTSLTTVVGFGSLILTDIDIIARFGLWASVGAVLEFISTFFLLPTLVKVFKIKNIVDPQCRSLQSFNQLSKNLNRLTPPRKWSFLLLLTYVVSVFFLFQFKVSDGPLSLFPKSHTIVKDFDYLSDSRGWQGDASLVFDVSQNTDRQKSMIESILQLENVAKVESLFNVQQFMIGDDPYQFQKAIVLDLERHAINKRYRGKQLSYRHLIYFKQTEFNHLKQTLDEIRYICGSDCRLIGELVSYNEFMDKVPLGLMQSLLGSMILVALILLALAFWFKHPHPFGFTLGSLWGPTTLIILMKIFQIDINFLSCVFVCMMVGLTGDNGIQFLFAEKRYGRGNGIEYHQSCALQVGILLAFSCLFFLFSYFAPPRQFGPLMCFGFLLSLFGDIWLTKALSQTKSIGQS